RLPPGIVALWGTERVRQPVERQRHGHGLADEPLLPEPAGGAPGADEVDAQSRGAGGGEGLAADVAAVRGAPPGGAGVGRGGARQGASRATADADGTRDGKG